MHIESEAGAYIQILLSTYNGEKYLRDQLDSYLTLEQADRIKVLIRDDGSCDGTREILQEYAYDKRFHVEYGDHIGTNASYQWLLENADSSCKYFAFSDQDDVWLPHKLSVAEAALEQCSQEELLLFASRSQITNEDLQTIGYSLNPKSGLSFYNAMIQNVLPGHTQVFNNSLRRELCRHGVLNAHVVDWWLYLVASAKGRAIFCPECTVLHRQHNNNTVGYQMGFFMNLSKRIRYIRNGKGNAISLQLQAFFHTYQGGLPDEYEEEIQRYLDGLGSFRKRIRYLMKSRVYRQRRWESFLFSILYLIGKYDL